MDLSYVCHFYVKSNILPLWMCIGGMSPHLCLSSKAVMLDSTAGRSNFTSERLPLPPVLPAMDCKTSVQGSVPQSALLQAGGEQKAVPASASALRLQRHCVMVLSQRPERTQKYLAEIGIQSQL